MEMKGSTNPLARINEDKVKLIHAIKIIKKVNNETLGNLFGLKRSTISGITRRYAWKHVQPPTVEEAGKLVAAYDALEKAEKERIAKETLGSETPPIREFLKSKKSKSTRWVMRPFSDNQGINNFRYSMGVKK